jgi:hypothetical protein
VYLINSSDPVVESRGLFLLFKEVLPLLVAIQMSYIAEVSRQLSPLVIMTSRLLQQLAVPVNIFPVTS